MLHNIIKKIAISWRDYSLNWRDDLESARTRRRNDDPTMNPRVYKWVRVVQTIAKKLTDGQSSISTTTLPAIHQSRKRRPPLPTFLLLRPG